MSAPALRVAGLGKRYRLGLTHAGSLSEAANRWARRLRGLPPVETPVNAAPGADPSDRKGDFWALRDVGFEVQPGEVVGVIGRNGAGKSTLLKILSRVTSPTVGEVRVRGRVGSLLEVGTGFHPELTGRENVYMNATLLGMSKREVRAKLEEIVDFAGVEKFLDTPVKRYSSGMKVRLGFAVAANLEPEVLIVDEVLSVGDAEFQKKCLGKMQDVAGHGRTVLFVSHNMTAVNSLCSRGILVVGGRVEQDGPVAQVLDAYLEQGRGERNGILDDSVSRTGSGRIRFQTICLFGSEGGDVPTSGEELQVLLKYCAADAVPLDNCRVTLNFKDRRSRQLFSCPIAVYRTQANQHFLPAGEFRFRVPRLPLPAGTYSVDVFAAFGTEVIDYIQEAVIFEVAPGDYYGTGRMPHHGGSGVLVEFNWIHGPQGEVGGRADSISPVGSPSNLFAA